MSRTGRRAPVDHSQRHLPLLIVVRNRAGLQKAVSDVVAYLPKIGMAAEAVSLARDPENDDRVLWYPNVLDSKQSDWEGLVYSVIHRMQRLKASYAGETVFHIFCLGPAALMLGIGAVIKHHYAVALYHLFDTYVQVYNFTPERPPQWPRLQDLRIPAEQPYKLILTDKWPTLTDEMVISLELTGTPSARGVKELVSSRPHPTALLTIENQFGNSLEPFNDWRCLAQEIYTELNQALRQGVGRIHLCLNMPIEAAFAVGMALGNKPPVTVYQWYRPSETLPKEGYYPVLTLDRLRD